MDYLLLFTTILLTSLISIISIYFAYITWSKKRKFEKSFAEHRKYLKMEKELDTEELVKNAYALLKNIKNDN